MRINELYSAPSVQAVLGPTLRPGGMLLTQRILEYISPEPGSWALDAGCSYGASLSLLRQYGLRAIGLDICQEFLLEAQKHGHDLVHSSLNTLPFTSQCLDFILCECAWNLTDKETSLAEFHRVLRPQGILAVTDMFVQGELDQSWPVQCCFAQATTLERVQEQVMTAGFHIEVLEDQSQVLKKAAADFVFRYGSLHGFWQAVTGDPALAEQACTSAKEARPGLFLLIARRI